jgi:hypothetical protein
MQKYTDVVTSARSGAAIPSASVTVKTSPGGATATIYSDDGVTTQANPLTTDSNGEFTFYAADGEYTLTVSGTGITSRTIGPIILHDPADSDDYMPSTDVSFTPSGSGALSRTMQAKGREIISAADFVSDTTGATSAVADLVEAYTAAAGRVLEFPTGTYLIDSAITFPANVTLLFSGGILKINDGVTVRIYQQPLAGRYQIFNIVGTDADESNWGDVAFNDSDSSPTTPYGNVIRVKPEWWGATQATSITASDSTTAFRKCFRSYKPIARNQANAKVVVDLEGTYVISDTVYVHTQYSIDAKGYKSRVIGNSATAAFTMFKFGGYLANGTTETLDTGAYYPTLEWNSTWFTATGANAASQSMVALGLVNEGSTDEVIYSFNVNKCWFSTFRAAVINKAVSDSSFNDCFFDSSCQEQVTLSWTTTSSRPTSGGVTFNNCSFLPVNYAISASYWSQLIIGPGCRFYLGTGAAAKAIRVDARCGSIQIAPDALFYTLATKRGNNQHAFYFAARCDDFQCPGGVFENITNIVYKDGANASVFGTFSNIRAEAISKESFTEQSGGNNSLGHMRVMGGTWQNAWDRIANLTSRADFDGNELTNVSNTPPGTSATSGGTFTLTFEGQTTAGIAYNASTTDVKDALELLSTIDTVTVTGSAGAFVVEFTGTHANADVAMMTGSAASLTPTSAIRILKSQISNGSNNTKQTIEYMQIPAVGSELAAIVLRGAAGGGASNSRVQNNVARTSGWLTASYRQSALGQADLTGIVSADNKSSYNVGSFPRDNSAVYVECTRSFLSNEGALIEAWDNNFNNVYTVHKATTGNTATALFAGTLYHEGSHVYITAMVTAKDQADPSVENALYRVDGAIKLEAAASTLLNNTTTAIFENTGTMDAAVVDSTSGNIELQVTGVTGVTIHWTAKLTTVLL